MKKAMNLTSVLILLFTVFITHAQENLVKNTFFVFNNGIRDTAAYKLPESQVGLAAEIGFKSVEKNGLDNFDEYYKSLIDNNMTLSTVYVQVNLDEKQNPYDPRLEETFKTVQGSNAMIWLYVTSKTYKPSSAENDPIAVPILQEIADRALHYGINVMIYPHINFWVDNVDDAVRVAAKVNRRNLGVAFNLCHFLADQGTKAEAAFLPAVEKAMPYLFAISLNGADKPTDEIMRSSNVWNYLIQPLGEGNYDTYGYLKTFLDRGFTGPVGLQCFNISQEKTVFLKKSLKTWENYRQRYSLQTENKK